MINYDKLVYAYDDLRMTCEKDGRFSSPGLCADADSCTECCCQVLVRDRKGVKSFFFLNWKLSQVVGSRRDRDKEFFCMYSYKYGNHRF